jgi:formylglycine-generating enzyme required for sulfatase activity
VTDRRSEPFSGRETAVQSPSVRPLALLLLLACFANLAEAAEPPTSPSWPMWDGHESVEQYSKKAGLEPTRTLDLGNGIKLEMVLIPAGKFTMGTPEPEPVDEEPYVTGIWIGQFAAAASGGVLLVLLGVIVIRAIRRRQRPQYSLARFVAIIVVVGVGVLGGTHRWESTRLLAEAKAEYQAALARYKEAAKDERPAHQVTLTRPFYMGKFEVTQEQYQQVMGMNPSAFKGRGLPVEQVSWDDAQEFCKKASEKTGLTVRSPTEAEWEYTCRAGTRTTYYTGDAEADLDRAAWYDKNSMNTTRPVGQKAANAWGLYDMHGNVWEWCGDWYEAYRAEAAVDPQGPAQGAQRALRGGLWCGNLGSCRSAYRFWLYPVSRGPFIGFRVAADVPPKAP